MTVRHDGLTVDWLGYATLRIDDGETVVYLDPGRYGVLTGDWEPDTEGVAHPPARDYRPEDGDVVCVSHVHHYDPDGIERVAGPDATVVAFEGIDRRAADRDLPRVVELPHEVTQVGMKDSLTAAGVDVWTTPAYNEPGGPHTRPDGTPYHPKGSGCGFLVDVGDSSVFWPGDTDVLPGHRTMDVSLLCPPIGRSSRTMDRREAAALAARIEPDLVLPVHYNTHSNLEADSRTFAADVAAAGVPVVLDES